MTRTIVIGEKRVDVYYFWNAIVKIPTSVGQWYVERYNIIESEKISILQYFKDILKGEQDA